MITLAEPVEVGVVCQKKDKPVPKKFKWAPSPNDETVVVEISKILSVEEIREVGSRAYLYRCQSFIDGLLKTYELKFIIDRHEWQLFKM